VAHRLIDVAHHEPHLLQRTEQPAHHPSSLARASKSAPCFKVLYFASIYCGPNVFRMSDERADLILEHLVPSGAIFPI
jgi:hypothetical protein